VAYKWRLPGSSDGSEHENHIANLPSLLEDLGISRGLFADVRSVADFASPPGAATTQIDATCIHPHAYTAQVPLPPFHLHNEFRASLHDGMSSLKLTIN